jgi:hypothetical protein
MSASGFHFSRDVPEEQFINEIATAEKFSDEVSSTNFLSRDLIF